MARKPPGRRGPKAAPSKTVQARIDAELFRKLRVLAAYRNVETTKILDDLIRGPIEDAYRAVIPVERYPTEAAAPPSEVEEPEETPRKERRPKGGPK